MHILNNVIQKKKIISLITIIVCIQLEK